MKNTQDLKMRDLPSSIEETAWRKEFPGRRSTRSGRKPQGLMEGVAGDGVGTAGGGGVERECRGWKKSSYEPFTPTLSRNRDKPQNRIFRV